MDETDTLSNKAKEYLNRKLNESKNKIAKMKRKRKVVKILYYSSIISSVSLATIISVLAASFSLLPIYIIPILSILSGILTSLSVKFNFENKKIEINKILHKIQEIQENLDYVISCNGNFNEGDFKQIISDLSIL